MSLWVRYARNGAAAGEAAFGTLHDGMIQLHEGDLFAAPRPVGAAVALADVALLPPVRPGCFIGLWNNFYAAAAKQGNAIPEGPLYFLKAPGSIVGPGVAISALVTSSPAAESRW